MKDYKHTTPRRGYLLLVIGCVVLSLPAFMFGLGQRDRIIEAEVKLASSCPLPRSGAVLGYMGAVGRPRCIYRTAIY